MAAKPTEAEAWVRAEHEAELLRVARVRAMPLRERVRAMPLRERLRALENRSRLLALMRERRNSAPSAK